MPALVAPGRAGRVLARAAARASCDGPRAGAAADGLRDRRHAARAGRLGDTRGRAAGARRSVAVAPARCGRARRSAAAAAVVASGCWRCRWPRASTRPSRGSGTGTGPWPAPRRARLDLQLEPQLRPDLTGRATSRSLLEVDSRQAHYWKAEALGPLRRAALGPHRRVAGGRRGRGHRAALQPRPGTRRSRFTFAGCAATSSRAPARPTASTRGRRRTPCPTARSGPRLAARERRQLQRADLRARTPARLRCAPRRAPTRRG